MKNESAKNDEENILEYTLVGNYYLPNLALNQENRIIGKYRMIRKEFLREHRPGLFSLLLMEDRVDSYLADIDTKARTMVEQFMQ